MKVCEYCNEQIVVKNSRSVTNHYKSCKVYKQKIIEVASIVTKNFLQREYIEGGKSLHYLRRQLGLKRNRLLKKKLKEFGLSQVSVTDSRQLEFQRQLISDTCNKKYGADTPLNKGTSSRQKLEQNLLTNHGVTNVFQRKDVIAKIKQTVKRKYGTNSASSSPIIRERVKKTCIERYGVDNVWKSPEIIDQIKQTKVNNPKAYSIASDISQKLFFAIYKKLSLDLQKHTYFLQLNKEFGQKFGNKYYCYDFVITSNKKCIEFNGNYWHMNPKMHNANDVNSTTNKTASEIWALDKEKQDCLRSKGFDVLVIWQRDYTTHPIKTVRQCLQFLTS
jgi:hypothetical protein